MGASPGYPKLPAGQQAEANDGWSFKLLANDCVTEEFHLREPVLASPGYPKLPAGQQAEANDWWSFKLLANDCVMEGFHLREPVLAHFGLGVCATMEADSWWRCSEKSRVFYFSTGNCDRIGLGSAYYYDPCRDNYGNGLRIIWTTVPLLYVDIPDFGVRILAEPKRPKSLVLNEALLKSFINGDLEPAVEAKVANYLESRPELLERMVSRSDGVLLERLRTVQQRSEIEPQAAVEAEVIRPVIVEKQPSADDSSIPRQLAEYSGYKVAKELGCGGMGVVYLAKNLQMDRLEVLKVLNQRLLNHEGAKERFMREIRSISKLSHANIVTSYSILPLDNLIVFAMEYVHGIDLHKFTHKYKPMSVGLACFFAKQIAAGLQHAHEKGLVHRDIKPSNVIVYKSGDQLQLKILDFGLAKATSEEAANPAGLTQDGTMLGTPEYMSPEQTLNAAKADIRADIYSLGCTLYFMLTGKPPFTGTHGAVLIAHAQHEPTALNLIRPEVSVELAAVVGKMLAKGVRKRYQSPSEVAIALSPFVNQLRTVANQPGAVEAASNTVNDLNASDRETSVESSFLALSHAADSRAAEQPLTTLGDSLKANRAATQSRPGVFRAKAEPRFPKWFLPTAVALGAMIFCFAFWQLASLTFKTPKGTIVVENMPADAQVLVDGQKVEIVWNAGRDKAEVSIETGAHQLRVLNQGNEIFGDKVSVKGGDSTVVKLRVVKPSDEPGVAIPIGSDPFNVDSLWVDAKNNLRLTVLARSGETFSARFLVKDSIERIVSGTYAAGKVAWLAKDVRAVKGSQGSDNSGTLVKDDEGYRLDFTWGNGGKTTSWEGGTFVLKLQPPTPSTTSKVEVQEATPEVQETTPTIRETTPEVQEVKPKVQETASNVSNAMPTAAVTLPEQKGQSTLQKTGELQTKPRMQFHFNGDAKDAILGSRIFQLKSTKFTDNALYLNGIYDPAKNGYMAICKDSEINVENFTVAMRFLSHGFGESTKPMVHRNNLITGGHYERWFCLERSPAEGNLIVSLRDYDFSQEIEGVGLENEKWTVVACSVDVPGHKTIIAVNSRVVSVINLPAKFKIGKAPRDEKLWTFTNYSNGNVFQGLVDEFVTYDRALNAEEITQIPLLP